MYIKEKKRSERVSCLGLKMGGLGGWDKKRLTDWGEWLRGIILLIGELELIFYHIPQIANPIRY